MARRPRWPPAPSRSPPPPEFVRTLVAARSPEPVDAVRAGSFAPAWQTQNRNG
jgi:hypothetical protein